MIKNMIKTLLFASLVGGWFVASAGVCRAQGPDFGSTQQRPAVSPYLNLLDQGYAFGGISPYQTLVRPLIEQQDSTNRQQTQIQQLQRGQRASSSYGNSRGTGASVRATGHQTRFLNYSHYYTMRTTANAR